MSRRLNLADCGKAAHTNWQGRSRRKQAVLWALSPPPGRMTAGQVQAAPPTWEAAGEERGLTGACRSHSAGRRRSTGGETTGVEALGATLVEEIGKLGEFLGGRLKGTARTCPDRRHDLIVEVGNHAVCLLVPTFVLQRLVQAFAGSFHRAASLGDSFVQAASEAAEVGLFARFALQASPRSRVMEYLAGRLWLGKPAPVNVQKVHTRGSREKHCGCLVAGKPLLPGDFL